MDEYQHEGFAVTKLDLEEIEIARELIKAE